MVAGLSIQFTSPPLKVDSIAFWFAVSAARCKMRPDLLLRREKLLCYNRGPLSQTETNSGFFLISAGGVQHPAMSAAGKNSGGRDDF